MNVERPRPEARKIHECVIKHREHVDITGVKEVISFDEGEVLLVTDCGDMTLEGDGLRVGTLDTDKGIISVDGKINALYYTDTQKKSRRGLFSRDKG
ncbi:MAG: sporulation protein YabP [Eubacteriales bacterium]|jgi:sporulation protein YabP